MPVRMILFIIIIIVGSLILAGCRSGESEIAAGE